MIKTNALPLHQTATTWVSRYLTNVYILYFIGAKGGGSGGDNWSCKTCKAPVKMSPPTNQPFLSPNQQCQSTEGNSCVVKHKNETQERQHINQNAKHQHKTKAVFANAKYITPDPHSPVHRTNNSTATDIRQPKTPRLIITHTASAQTITTVLAKTVSVG